MSEITLLSNRELMELKSTSLSNDGKLFECITPGCPTEDASSRDITTFTAASLYLMWGQVMGLSNPEFVISKIRDATHDIFHHYMEHYITLDLYRDRSSGNVHVYYPMKLSSEVQSFENSTVAVITTMHNAISNNPVACLYSTLVHIDMETRRSVPIPDHIRSSLSHLENERPRLGLDFLSVSPPINTFEYSVVVRVSDTSILQHERYSLYITYCMDAALVAASRDRLRGIAMDKAPWLVKKNKCRYSVEAFAGDTLKITLWQDDQKPEMINFRVYKLDGRLTYASCMEFYLNEEVDITLDNLISDESIDLKSPASTDSTFVLSDVDLSRWKHVSYNKDRTRAELILPRPLILSLNPRGQISAIRFANYFECARIASTHLPGFCINSIDMMGQSCGIFYVQLEMIFEQDLYKMSTDYQGLYRPFRTVVKFHSFSRSSVCLEIKLYDTENGACIATSYIKQLTVDFATRKAVPIPASLRQRYSEICSNQEGLKPVPDIPSPDECFTHYDTVRHSDIDVNKHLNMAVYLKLCMDAAIAASNKGGLSKFYGDALSREMKAIRCSYIKECDLGEALQIKVWQDKEWPDKLNFRVTKSNGSLSMLCSMEFYSTKNLSKL